MKKGAVAGVSSQNGSVDLYEVLQVHPKADAEIIALVYRYIVKKYHPDIAPSHLRSDYEERMKQINEAYAILSDPDKRRDYDCHRPTEEQPPDTILLRFENAAVLTEAAVAGGGEEECYQMAARLLQSIAREVPGTEVEYEALIRLALRYSTRACRTTERLQARLNEWRSEHPKVQTLTKFSS